MSRKRDLEVCYEVTFRSGLSEYERRQHNRLIARLHKVEAVEDAFDLEFSCGGGLFLSDLADDSQELARYDGQVDWTHPPRDRKTRKLLPSRMALRILSDADTLYYQRGIPGRGDILRWANTSSRSL